MEDGFHQGLMIRDGVSDGNRKKARAVVKN